MNLWEIQTYVAGVLRAHSKIAAQPGGRVAIPVLEDDGGYPKIPDMERHLRREGLVLVVWGIQNNGLHGDNENPSLMDLDVYVPIVIEENVKACRSRTGVNVPAEQALQWVFEALLARPTKVGIQTTIRPFSSPFQNFGKIGGVNKIMANFVLRTFITPTT
jgi:hypothetical protein